MSLLDILAVRGAEMLGQSRSSLAEADQAYRESRPQDAAHHVARAALLARYSDICVSASYLSRHMSGKSGDCWVAAMSTEDEPVGGVNT